MNIKWIAGLGGFVLMLTASHALAWSCARGFVDTGERAATVRQKCGPPDFIYRDPGDSRHGRSKSADEFWYYNPGPSGLLRVLRFHGGVLQRIDTGGYGFNATPGRCTPQDIRIGMSVYELAAHCGKPHSKRKQSARMAGGKQRSSASARREEIWVYDFGPQYLLHRVVIADAEVQSLETASRKR